MEEWMLILVFGPLVPCVLLPFLEEKQFQKISFNSLLVLFGVALLLFVKNLTGQIGAESIFRFSLSLADSVQFNLGFSVTSPITALGLLVLNFLGLLVNVLYLRDKKENIDQGSLVFTLFSLTLAIAADSLVLIFCAWSLTTFYKLLKPLFEKKSVGRPQKLELIAHLIADALFLFSLLSLKKTIGSLDLANLDENVELGGSTVLLLMLACFAKSFLMPLHFLRERKKGLAVVIGQVLPKGALGCLLLFRIRHTVEYFDGAASLLLFVGLASAISAAWVACSRNSIKNILFYSVISQIGLVFLSYGLLLPEVGLLHYVNHSLSKVLFLLLLPILTTSAAKMKMDQSGFGSIDKITLLLAIFSWLAVVGLPPFSSFFTQNEILWASFAGKNGGLLVWFGSFLAVMLTGVYTTRLFYLLLARSSTLQMPFVEVNKAFRFLGLLVVLILIFASVPIIESYSNENREFLWWLKVSLRGQQVGSFEILSSILTLLCTLSVSILTFWMLYTKSRFGFVKFDEFRRKFIIMTGRTSVERLFDKRISKLTLSTVAFVHERVEEVLLRLTRLVLRNCLTYLSEELRACYTGNIQRYSLCISLSFVVIATVLFLG